MEWKRYVKRVLWALAAVAAGVVFARFVDEGYSTANYPLFTVSPRDFDITVHTVGTLDAAEAHMISSTIKGDKGKIVYLVEDGAPVRTGDVLVRLDSSPFEAEVASLTKDVLIISAAVDVARQMLAWEKHQVERAVRNAAYNLKVAELEYEKLVKGDGPLQETVFQEEKEKAAEAWERYDRFIRGLEKLNVAGYEASGELDAARRTAAELLEQRTAAEKKYDHYVDHVLPLKIEKSRAAVENAEMELEQTRKSGVYQIAKAQAALKETIGKQDIAEAALAQARTALEKTVLKAPIPGIAILYETFRDGLKRKPRVGDRVWQNQPLLYLPDVSSMIVKTRIREVDLHRIALGQHCGIRVDAYPQARFNGQIVFVGVLASERSEGYGGEKYFQLTVSIAGEDQRLRPGMTSRVSILTDHAADALCVPIEAVYEENGRPHCYRYANPHFEKVPVTVGRQDEAWVEILSGLRSGERVSVLKPRGEAIE